MGWDLTYILQSHGLMKGVGVISQTHLTLPRPAPRCAQVRGLAMGVATLVNRVTSGCIAISFLSLTSALTPAVTYYTFAAIALGACYFIARYVPETKGRALEEVRAGQRVDRQRVAGQRVQIV